jgi:AAHS family 4-hydroxybenzoate transporter-like MFS transporter
MERAMTDPIDVRTAIDGQHRGFYPMFVVAACAAAMVVEGYDSQVAAYAAPAIIRAWHIDRSLFGPVFAAALVGYLIGATLLSGLSDRLGRKRVIAFGNLFFGVLTLASAFATTIPVLLSLRFVAGLGLGCSIPAAIALGVEYAPEHRRAFRVSLLFVGYTVGAALGGLLTAVLMAQWGWQSAFLFGGGMSVALGLLLLVTLPESMRFLALRGGRNAEIARVLRRFRPDLPITPQTRFTVADHAAESGMLVRHLFTEGRGLVTILLWSAFICSLAAHYFLTSWLPTMLDASGIPLTHAVVAGSLIQVGGAAGSLIVGRLVDRIGMVAVVGAFVLSVPFVVLIGLAGMPEPLLMVVVTMAGLCLLGAQIGLNGLAGTIYPTFVRASGAGWALGVGRIGSILGPVVGGVLIGAKLSTPALFVCAAVPGALAAATVFVLQTVIGHQRTGEARQARRVSYAGQARAARPDSSLTL